MDPDECWDYDAWDLEIAAADCDASHAEPVPCWPEWTPPSVGGVCPRETLGLGLRMSDTDCWGPVQARAEVAYSARDGWTLGSDSHFRPGRAPAPSGDSYRDYLVAEELDRLAAWRESERERLAAVRAEWAR